MQVSVLISTWNNSKQLAVTLEAFAKCFIPPGMTWQLVLINNNCRDDTDDVVLNYTKTLPILYIKEPMQGLSRARNKGIAAATGELIIFTDDDVRPDRDWINVYWKAYLEDGSKYFWGGPVESEFEGKKPEPELLNIAPASVRGLNFGPKRRILNSREYFISCNWAVPLKVVKELGGFDVNKGLKGESEKFITGEETCLMDRIAAQGLIPLYLPEARIKHYVPTDKTGFDHIVKRCEAGAVEGCERYKFRLRFWVLFGKPVGLYLHVLYAYSRYILKKLTLKRGISEYVKWRIAKGVAKGFENKLRGNRLAEVYEVSK